MINYLFYDITEKINKDIKYYDFDDFLKNALLTEYIILKEEKEILFFFNTLNQKEKKLFGINNYFDCIDIGYNYYNLIKQLYENDIKLEDIKVNKWQKNLIEIIYDIHNRMIKSVKKTKIAPRYLKYLDYKLNHSFLDEIEKVDFLNKFYLTKLEKRILEDMKCSINFHQYINKNDFDKETHTLKSITLPDKINNNINIIQFKDDFALNVYLSKILKESNNETQIMDFEKKQYLISQNILNTNIRDKMDKSRTYRLLNNIYNILNEQNKLEFLYYAINNNDFVEFFDIKLSDILFIKQKVKEAYLYYNNKEFGFVETIKNYDFNNLIDEIATKFKEESSKFIESATEVLANYNFNFENNIDNLRDKIKLLMKYLKGKNNDKFLKESKFKIDNSECNVDNLIVLNGQETVKKNNNFLLSKLQRIDLNLLSDTETKQLLNYQYIRNILNTQNVTILYIKNVEKDIQANSFIMELIIKYNLAIKDYDITTNNKLELLDKIYKPSNREENKIFLTKDDKLTLKESDIKNIRITGSNIYDFMDDPVVIILDKLIKENFVLSNQMLDSRTLGNIIHEVFESVESEKSFDEIMDNCFEKMEQKINKEFIELFKYIYKDRLRKEFESFRRETRDLDMEAEMTLFKEYKNITFSARLDLLISGCIIDIKTGSDNDKNIKKYSYQLGLYKYLLDNKNYDLLLYFPLKSKKIGIDTILDDTIIDSAIDYLKEEQILPSKNNMNHNWINILRGDKYVL